MFWFSCDPGKYGALVVWQDEKPIEWCDADPEKYKNLFEKYKGSVIQLERITAFGVNIVMSLALQEDVGFIKGLAYNLCEVNEKGNMPIEWKKPWPNLLKPKGKGVKWTQEMKKQKDIEQCEKEFPDIDLRTGKIVKHRDGSTTEVKRDGLADALLIGLSRIKRGLM